MTTEKTREFQESRDGVAERERSAATLLAALLPILAVQPRLTAPDEGAQLAVKWADALRAALRGGE